MSRPPGRCPLTLSSRRGFLAAAGGLAGTLGTAGALKAATSMSTPQAVASSAEAEPFYGAHQSGILTPQQPHTYFAAFDIVANRREEVEAMLRAWTIAAARMAAGETAAPLGDDLSVPASDSGEAAGLGPGRLTITFGFGPGLFFKNGQDRFGLAAHRPDALADLPRFNGDQLIAERTGGDISVQACAEHPQIAFHAVRQLARLSYGAAQLRWVQTGFSASSADPETPRNLMGFKDGTQNPVAPHPIPGVRNASRPGLNPDAVLWVDEEGPAWMRGGSYVVARRIRISLEHWDRSDTDFQEQVIGRHKKTGAPLGAKDEFDPLDLAATDKDGNLIIPDDAHVRLANAATNGGAQILRRSYSYDDGVTFMAERWPPWRQGMMYDSGLLFVAYQRDPRTGFIKIFDQMSKLDALNQFSTHVGGGLFACPPGASDGGYIGQALFEPA